MTSFLLAELPSVNWSSFALFSVIGYLAVGGSCALNCYFDRDIDALMGRTSKRAIPSGAVQPKRAAVFGLVLLTFGIFSAYAFFGLLAAAMIFTGSFVYVAVYTLWLKRFSRWGVIIGGISGSMAALYGWTATGNMLTLTPILIAALDFFWTPGHLWGLAVRNVEEYRKAHLPVLPVIEGVNRSSGFILAFNAATIGLSFVFPAIGVGGFVYIFIAASAGLILLRESLKLIKRSSPSQAYKVFFTSMPYLAVIMVALLLDKLFFLGFSL
jgi:protoheme IX farnesyltransferase